MQHAHMHTCTLHTCTHTHMRTTHMHTYTRTLHTCTHAHMHTCTLHMHTHTCTYTHAHYTCTHAHMHTYTHAHYTHAYYTRAHMHTTHMHTHMHTTHMHTHTHPHTQHGNEGDGYSQKSPHTSKEKFEGLNILDAAKVPTLHYTSNWNRKTWKCGWGSVPWKSFIDEVFCLFRILQKAVEGTVRHTLSRLYVNASRRVLDKVAKEFGLKTPLYFSYTHLVCRTAKEGTATCLYE